MNRLLHAKHWQIFLLTIGIPMIAQFLMMGWMMSQMMGSQMVEPEELFAYMRFFPLVILLSAGTLYAWLWATGVGLQKKIPSEIKLGIGKFKAALVYALVYFCCFLGLFIFLITLFQTQADLGGPDFDQLVWLPAIILPLHLFAMFCIFYCLYFVAKAIKTVELQREVSFSDFVGEFFMLWFYPIGIWILQPKINQIAKS